MVYLFALAMSVVDGDVGCDVVGGEVKCNVGSDLLNELINAGSMSTSPSASSSSSLTTALGEARCLATPPPCPHIFGARQ